MNELLTKQKEIDSLAVSIQELEPILCPDAKLQGTEAKLRVFYDLYSLEFTFFKKVRI